MIINERHIRRILFCKYCFFLESKKGIDTTSEFDIYNKNILSELQKSHKQIQISNRRELSEIINNKSDINCQVTTKTSEFSINIFSSENEEVTVGDYVSQVFPSIDYKLLLAWKLLVLKEEFKIKVNRTVLIDQNNKTRTIRFSQNDFNEVQEVLSEIQLIQTGEEPTLVLCDNCKLCGVQDYCLAEAKKQSNLTLLGSVNKTQLNAFHKKGIFTIQQLSYTFRPKRNLKKASRKIKKHHTALKALSLRKEKVFFFDDIIIPNNRTHVFVDIETVPHRGEVYLISCIIKRSNKQEESFSFWSEDRKEEKNIIQELLKLLSSCKNVIIFHYGKLEYKFFERLNNQYKNHTTKRILESCCDLFGMINPSIYFPTYTNSLKEIANYLGFEWSTNLEGYKSVLLRLKWEHANNEKVKQELIKYNLEDCRALSILYEFIYTSNIQHLRSNENEQSNIVFGTSFLKEERKRRFGGHLFDKPNFLIEQFDFINKCSYFDYQRNKILIKTDTTLKSRKEINDRRKFAIKINNTKYLSKKHICPFCGSSNIRTKDIPTIRNVVDLKFFEGGIKRWCTQFIAYEQSCRTCKKVFFPEKFKLYRRKYGHNLLSWVIYNHIVNRISFGKIEKTLATNFQISVGFVGSETIYNFKTKAADYYRLAYNRLLKNISKWSVLHIDETKVRVQGVGAYVWVFTNGNEVIFHFSANRKSDFLIKLLHEFDGVLVSDFYKGYDFLKCHKQKCLVHLTRDINDLLFKEQQNADLIFIANHFASTLSSIVKTVNVYGLKKSKLKIHKTDIQDFFHEIETLDAKTESGIKLKKRIIRYKDELFNFINFNNVPWSNNTAEHAFRHFAEYRKVSNGVYTENGLKKYLILLSVYETCRYKEIDFFSYLISREKFIENYEMKYTNRGNLKKGYTKHRMIREFE